MYFLLGLGSNIYPETYLPAAILALLRKYQVLYLSRIIRTPPVGEYLTHHVYNAVAWLHSHEKPQVLKQRLIDIEETLGRDRRDTHRAEKDRTIDIDIEFCGKKFEVDDLPSETYLHGCTAELMLGLGILHITEPDMPDGIELSMGKLSIGHRALRLEFEEPKNPLGPPLISHPIPARDHKSMEIDPQGGGIHTRYLQRR